MAHVEDGEKYYIRKEYTEVSKLGKEGTIETTPLPQNDGGGTKTEGSTE